MCSADNFTDYRAFHGGQGHFDLEGIGGLHYLYSVIDETFYSSQFALGILCALPQKFDVFRQ